MPELRFRTSCDACLNCKVKCSQTKPSCWRCTQHGHPCVYSQCRRIGRPPKTTGQLDTSQQHQVGNDATSRQEECVQEVEQEHQKTSQIQQHGKAGEQPPFQSHDSSIPSGTSVMDMRTDEGDPLAAISTLDFFPGNRTAVTNLEDLDMTDQNQSGWQSRGEWPQELSMSSGNMAPTFDSMTDFDSFTHTSILASDLPELDGFFDPELIDLPTTSSPVQQIPYLAMSTPLDSGGEELGRKTISEFAAVAESGYFSDATPEPQSSTLAPSSSRPKPTTISLEQRSAPAPPSAGPLATPLQHSSIHRFQYPLATLQTSGFGSAESIVSASSAAGTSRSACRPRTRPNQRSPPGRRGSMRAEKERTGRRGGKLLSQLLSSTSSTPPNEDFSRPSPTPCSGKCHASLIRQLSHLTSCWSSQRHISLDKLLNLDREVRQQREKVLQCTSCVGSNRQSSQIETKTLMFVIMVMENLLGLFERECNLHQRSSPGSDDDRMVLEVDEALEDMEESNTDQEGDEDDAEESEEAIDSSLSSSLLSKMLQQRRRDLKRLGHRQQHRPVRHSGSAADLGQKIKAGVCTRRHHSSSSSSSNASLVRGLSTPSRSGPPSLCALPQTAEPLLVGAYQVDDVTRATFSRYLLQLHFQRQMEAFHQLEQILTATQERSGTGRGTADVSHRIACETLADIHQRVEHFLGFIAFVE